MKVSKVDALASTVYSEIDSLSNMTKPFLSPQEWMMVILFWVMGAMVRGRNAIAFCGLVFLVLCAGRTEAREVPGELLELKVLALAPSDGRVVVRDGSGSLHVLAVGDPVPGPRDRAASDDASLSSSPLATVTRIEVSRLVLLMTTEDGPCEVWVDRVRGREKDRMRAVCSTTEAGSELSKPLIQPIPPPTGTGGAGEDEDGGSPGEGSSEEAEEASVTLQEAGS